MFADHASMSDHKLAQEHVISIWPPPKPITFHLKGVCKGSKHGSVLTSLLPNDTSPTVLMIPPYPYLIGYLAELPHEVTGPRNLGLQIRLAVRVLIKVTNAVAVYDVPIEDDPIRLHILDELVGHLQGTVILEGDLDVTQYDVALHSHNLTAKKISSTTTTSTIGPHRGAVTHHHDQEITSVSLSTRNMKNRMVSTGNDAVAFSVDVFITTPPQSHG
jgi:hypothetical protein